MLDLTGEAGERERGNGGCLLPTLPFQKAPGVWAGLSKLGSAKTVPAEGLRSGSERPWEEGGQFKLWKSMALKDSTLGHKSILSFGPTEGVHL